MKKKYEISTATLAIIPIAKNISRVIEDEDSFIVNKSTTQIVDDSCRFFGSSYQGRFEGTKSMIGVNYKSPIVVEETRGIIFFPTASPRFDNCTWVALKKMEKYYKDNKKSKILFFNGTEITIDISYSSLENQVLRATLLESVLLNRRKIRINDRK